MVGPTAWIDVKNPLFFLDNGGPAAKLFCQAMCRCARAVRISQKLLARANASSINETHARFLPAVVSHAVAAGVFSTLHDTLSATASATTALTPTTAAGTVAAAATAARIAIRMEPATWGR